MKEILTEPAARTSLPCLLPPKRQTGSPCFFSARPKRIFLPRLFRLLFCMTAVKAKRDQSRRRSSHYQTLMIIVCFQLMTSTFHSGSLPFLFLFYSFIPNINLTNPLKNLGTFLTTTVICISLLFLTCKPHKSNTNYCDSYNKKPTSYWK